MNCAPGNFSPSMPMNGMVPPSPMYIAGLPKNSSLAWSMASDSHGDRAGAFQPVLAFSSVRVTCAPYGGSRSRACCNSSPPRLPSRVGGRRRLSLSEVQGRSTLPADDSAGNPSAPVIDSAGRQVRLSTSSVRSSAIGVMPGRNGNLSWTSLPSTSATFAAC